MSRHLFKIGKKIKIFFAVDQVLSFPKLGSAATDSPQWSIEGIFVFAFASFSCSTSQVTFGQSDKTSKGTALTSQAHFQSKTGRLQVCLNAGVRSHFL